MLLVSSTFILSFIPLSIYTFVSWKKGEFNLLSPLFFPFIFFILYYGIPSLVCSQIFKEDLYKNAIYVQNTGIVCYLVGVGLYQLTKHRKYNKADAKYIYVTQHRVMMKSFLIIGMLLLTLYGIWSGVTSGLLIGKDVENLRRTAEIGKGIIKEPGVFFITFSTLWLLGLSFVKRQKIPVSHLLLLLFVMGVIFLTTAHKAPSFWIIIFAVALYNKYNQISPLKILILGICLFFLIGLADAIRGGETINFFNFVIRRGFMRYTGIYKTNYLSVIRMVDQRYLNLQYGKEYIQNAMIIIPRFLYPEKPLCFDYFLKKKLNLTFAGGGAPATPLGSLYLNFSFIGVVLGMIFIGYIYALLYKRYRAESKLSTTLIFLFILTKMINPSLLLAQLLLMILFVTFIIVTDEIFCTPIRKGFYQ